jgi:transcriptional regulator with XRE-family HTH domain
MTIGRNVKKALKQRFAVNPPFVYLTPGDVVRHMRELAEMTQEEFARKSGLKQTTVSGIEKNRINIGVERAKVIGKALGIHPAIILFPDYFQNVIKTHRKAA